MSNSNDFPETVADLNSWVKQHFMTFEGPGRAYFSLPFPVIVGFGDETKFAETSHRVIFVTIALKGQEDICCRSMAAHLRACVTHECFLDSTEPLFIRRWFSFEKSEFDKDEYFLLGRLAFWHPKVMERLDARLVKSEGAPVSRKAFMPEISWETLR